MFLIGRIFGALGLVLHIRKSSERLFAILANYKGILESKSSRHLSQYVVAEVLFLSGGGFVLFCLHNRIVFFKGLISLFLVARHSAAYICLLLIS